MSTLMLLWSEARLLRTRIRLMSLPKTGGSASLNFPAIPGFLIVSEGLPAGESVSLSETLVPNILAKAFL